jgi:hypothetical protein
VLSLFVLIIRSKNLKNIHLRRTLLVFIYLLCSYASVYCVISISIFGALSKIVLENYAPYPSIQVRYIWWYTHTWFMKWRQTSNMMRYKYKTILNLFNKKEKLLNLDIVRVNIFQLIERLHIICNTMIQIQMQSLIYFKW